MNYIYHFFYYFYNLVSFLTAFLLFPYLSSIDFTKSSNDPFYFDYIYFYRDSIDCNASSASSLSFCTLTLVLSNAL